MTQDILKYIQIIKKWWWVIFLLFVTTVGTMLAISFMSETQYEASVTVLISAPPPQEVPLFSQFGRAALSDEIARTRGSFIEVIEQGRVVEAALRALPDINMRASELRDNITIEPSGSDNLLQIFVRSPDREAAPILANTIVEVGLEQYGELLASPTTKMRSFIEQEFDKAKIELKTAEAELEQFKINNKVGDMKSVIDAQHDLTRALQIRRDAARIDGNLAEVQVIDKIILEREAELQDLVGLSAEYNELVGRVEQANATHNFLLDRRSESQIKENQIQELASIQIIGPARTPRNPVSAINNRIIILGAIASIIAGVLLTFLLENFELSRKSLVDSNRVSRSEAIPLSDNVS